MQPFAVVPMGSTAQMFGPAVNPSSNIDTSSTILLIASLLLCIGANLRRLREDVGADPAASRSPWATHWSRR